MIAVICHEKSMIPRLLFLVSFFSYFSSFYGQEFGNYDAGKELIGHSTDQH